MNILTLPFNQLIDIQISDRDGFLLMLTDSNQILVFTGDFEWFIAVNPS